MSTIRCVYGGAEPKFPATDQHPDAVRYQIGVYWVDAIGGAPTQAEVDAVLNPPFLTNSAEAMRTRQRAEAVDSLETEISKRPAGEQPLLRLIQQLLRT